MMIGNLNMKTVYFKFFFLLLLVCTVMGFISCSNSENRPNILWIIAEDASLHINPYGETAIQTPNLNKLAKDGITFTNAFVTNPVCSPSRSAMNTGMYQTSLGLHNHRSQRARGKGATSAEYFESYLLPDEIQTVSQLFKQAGYFITNANGPSAQKKGKKDYNFITEKSLYDGTDWKDCPADQPFFAQIQLDGGKFRNNRIDHKNFQIPPYYPDDPVIRDDWSSYLASWEKVDSEVGQIIEDLQQAGKLENTIVFFLTDHGISHLRGKQFLYDEGIQVPLFIRFPDRKFAGSVRDVFVLQIDLSATSLALAGIKIPEYYHAKNQFDTKLEKREHIFSARDRCDETIDIIRSLRTKKYKYIRNFLSYRPHAQFNQYKDDKAISKRMRERKRLGKLTELQARIFNPARPVEELYDLENDPFETVNLAGSAEHNQQLRKFRNTLHEWMIESGDLGLIPEPILEEIGRQAGNKYFTLNADSNKTLIADIVKVFYYHKL